MTRQELGKIYIIKNIVNDKVYIGQTIHSLELRFGQHCRRSKTICGHTQKLYNAFRKYGVDKFFIELIEDNIPVDNLNEREIYYVQKYNSFECGYNSNCGGDGKAISTQEALENVKQMLNDKVGYAIIAKKHNVNIMTIQRLAHYWGIRRYKKHISKDFLIDNIEKTSVEIAKILGVSDETVNRAFKRYGIYRGKGFHNHKLPQNKTRKPTLFD